MFCGSPKMPLPSMDPTTKATSKLSGSFLWRALPASAGTEFSISKVFV